jgi:hypothetical protein
MTDEKDLMGDSSTRILRPSISGFLLWAALHVGSMVALCALYHLVWPFFHAILGGRVAEYLRFSALTCFLFGLVVVLFFVLLASIGFALQRAFWEIRPGGVAMYRRGDLRRVIPWAEIARVTLRPRGIRLYLRYSVEPERLNWVPWRDARSFARYCNGEIRHDLKSMPPVIPGPP